MSAAGTRGGRQCKWLFTAR